jgi:hypothetical protein
MAVTPPPSITPAPTPAPQRGEKSTFSARVDAFVTWLTAAVGQFGAVATNVKDNAADAFGSATTAANAATTATGAANAAATSAGATLWVSGQSVAQYAAKISTLNAQTYRRKTATGSGTVDPSLDSVNYALLSVGQSAMELLAVATVSSPVVNIDFLNLFTDKFNDYLVVLEGLTNNASGDENLVAKVAVGGTLDNTLIFLTGSTVQAGAIKGVVGRLSIGNARAVGANKLLIMNSYYPRALDGAFSPFQGAGGLDQNGALSGLRVYWQYGSSFTGGTVRVYGLRATL